MPGESPYATNAPTGSRWPTVAVCAALIGTAAVVELALGRTPICTCGTIKLWHGVVFSAENSQHITDWYTFTHVVHGFVFYAILALAAPRVPVTSRFIAAVSLESAWEIAENSPFIIDRYRAATISLDYYGDSVLNSVSDVFAMMFGFWAALRLPAWKSVALVLAVELLLLVIIRDNLTLNVLMLIYPVDAIRAWQGGL